MHCPRCSRPVGYTDSYCPACAEPLQRKSTGSKVLALTTGLLLGLFVVILGALGLQWYWAQRDPRQIARRTLSSVVVLEPKDEDGRVIGLGTGFFIEPETIATNLHVIEGAWSVSVRTVEPQTEVPISGLLGMDRANDVALLKAGWRGRPVPIADGEPAMGSTVYVIGNPQGLEGSFAAGVVSAIRREGLQRFLQITAPISPGSSGSPVLNETGAAVGIATALLRGGQNLNIAVPISVAGSLLRATKEPRPLYEATLGAGRAREQARLRGPVRAVYVYPPEGRLRFDSRAFIPLVHGLLCVNGGPAVDAINELGGRQLKVGPCVYSFDLLGNIVGFVNETYSQTTQFEYEGKAMTALVTVDEAVETTTRCTVAQGTPDTEVHECTTKPCDFNECTERVERQFDEMRRILTEHRRGSEPLGLESRREFHYDPAGCLTSHTGSHSVGGRVLGASSAEYTQACDDLRDPVTLHVSGKTVVVDCSYERDAVGNWTTRTCRGSEGGGVQVQKRRIEYLGEAPSRRPLAGEGTKVPED